MLLDELSVMLHHLVPKNKQMSNNTGKHHACMSNSNCTSSPCAIPPLNKLYIGGESSFAKQIHIKAQGCIVDTSNSTDNSGPCTRLIQLPIAINQDDCHFKIPKMELRCKRLKRGQMRILSLSVSEHIDLTNYIIY
jgi:hypothetical protein